MRILSNFYENGNAFEALTALKNFVATQKAMPTDNFQHVEEMLHAHCVELERRLLTELLTTYDSDVPAFEVENKRYRKAVRSRGEYQSSVGIITLERTLYRSERNGPSVCPLELKAGIVEGRWTPLAAKQALHVVGELTPYRAEKLLKTLGNMTPSKSSLDRLPKQINVHWEAQREAFETALLASQEIPSEATSMSLSLDGVMIHMLTTKFKEPGYCEASCGTISFYNKEGTPLSTRQFGRMPEHKKATLKNQLRLAVEGIAQKRPDLTCVKVADGVNDNWEFLSDVLPEAEEALDFYHACEHLKSAYNAAFGEGSVASEIHFDKYRKILKDSPGGIEKVLRNLRYLAREKNKYVLRRELNYFCQHQKRMDYARLKAKDLPIGSGIVEATCKTLVQQRLKCSGMRWDKMGGQAILNIRSWIQSDCYDEAWNLIAAIYKENLSFGVANNVRKLAA
jgi:hypothetical protein